MVIALIILIPIISLSTGFLVLKAYSTGLRHNYELRHDLKPTVAKSPIEIYSDKREAEYEDKKLKEEAEREKEQANIMSEWLNGKVEE